MISFITAIFFNFFAFFFLEPEEVFPILLKSRLDKSVFEKSFFCKSIFSRSNVEKSVPLDSENTDYQAIQQWISEGNTVIDNGE